MSYVSEALISLEHLSSDDVRCRLEGENALWSLQYNTNYIETLGNIILGSNNFSLKQRSDATIAFKMVITSRWIQSLNFKNEPEDDLKNIIKNQLFNILLSDDAPDKIKSSMKDIVLKVYEEKWVDIWFLNELIEMNQDVDKVFFELLINSTTFIGHCQHNQDDYKELYVRLASLFASFMRKYLSSLPEFLVEMRLLLKSYSHFVYDDITQHMTEEEVSLFVEKLQEFVLQYPVVDDDKVITLKIIQMTDILLAKEAALSFWSKMHYDNSNFIKNNSTNLYGTVLATIKSLPPGRNNDDIFSACAGLLETLLAFYFEEMTFDEDKFDELFTSLVDSCRSSADMSEADFCTKEPLNYAKYILNRDVFNLNRYKTSLKRNNAFFNFITDFSESRDCIQNVWSRSVTNYLATCGLQNCDDILSKDFYWNFVSSLNQDGDDYAYENKSKTNKLSFKMDDKLQEALDLLYKDVHPLLKCDALKFIILQRKQFSQRKLSMILNELVELLNSCDLSVTSFAAFALQRIVLCEENNKPIISSDVLLLGFKKMFENVVKSLDRIGNQGNPFMINVLREFLSKLGMKMIPIPEDLMLFLRNEVLKLNTEPHEDIDANYIKHLYNCVGHLALFSVHKSLEDGGIAAESFEKIIMTAFVEVLNNKHTNQVPLICYIVIHTLLSRHQQTNPPKPFLDIVNKLMTSDLWFTGDDDDCMSHMIYDMKMFFYKYPSMIDEKHIESASQICRHLLRSQTRGFRAIQVFVSIVESRESSLLLKHLPFMFTNLIEASKINKHISFIKGLIVFVFYCIMKCGAATIYHMLKQLDDQFFPKFIKEVSLLYAKFTELRSDHDIAVAGLSMMVEYLTPLAVKNDDDMTLWTYLVVNLADVSMGYEPNHLIGNRNSDSFFRSYAYPLDYDYYSDLALDKWESCNREACDYKEVDKIVPATLKKCLEKCPQLASIKKFEDLNFDLKVRKKLKSIIKKNDLPTFPFLTYDGDDDKGGDDDDYEGDDDDDSWCSGECQSYIKDEVDQM